MGRKPRRGRSDALGAKIDGQDHEQIATCIPVIWEALLGSGISEVADHRERALPVTKVATEPFTDARPIEQIKHRTVVIPGLRSTYRLDHPVLEATLEPCVRRAGTP